MGRQPACGEQGRIAQRQLDGVLQPLLDGIEAADVDPRHIGDADQRLAQRRGAGL